MMNIPALQKAAGLAARRGTLPLPDMIKATPHPTV
jgi:hypothetical protein